MAIFKHGDLTR